jgi:hypothetical protein
MWYYHLHRADLEQLRADRGGVDPHVRACAGARVSPSLLRLAAWTGPWDVAEKYSSVRFAWWFAGACVALLWLYNVLWRGGCWL